MSILGDVLDELAETIIPEVAEIVFPDTCFIKRQTETKDAKGVIERTWEDLNVIAIPCTYEPKTRSRKDDGTGQWTSLMEYYLTMPTNYDESLIELEVDDRIEVQARGNQPVKTFKVIAVKNDSGVVNEVICNLEN
jgi:hypothetical protein